MGVGDLYGARRDPARDWFRRTTAAHRVVAWVMGSAALFVCAIVADIHQRVALSTAGITIAAVTYVMFHRDRDHALAAVATGGGDHRRGGRIDAHRTG